MKRLTTSAVLIALGFFCFAPHSQAAVLKHGDRGAQVEQVQQLLIARGLLDGNADGVYGEATVEAIKIFQASVGLSADGECGDQTLNLLSGETSESQSDGYAIKLGSRGDDVAEVQNILIAMGYMSGTADGVCGSKMVTAIKHFQSDAGLTADGVAGTQTLDALAAAAQQFEQGNSQPIEIIEGYTPTFEEFPTAEEPSIARFSEENSKTGDDDNSSSEGGYAGVGSVIKSGMHGDGVIDVQKKLIAQGFLSGHADGVCGAQTVAAIKNFQASVGLPADGVCGLMTYAALEDASYNSTDRTWDDVVNYENGYGNGYGRPIYVDATAYSAYDPGNGSYTARGTLLRRGIIAVDPNVIPLGTRVYIPGYGEAIADDTGGSIVGNRIDIAFDSHEEALYFGRQQLEIYIIG